MYVVVVAVYKSIQIFFIFLILNLAHSTGTPMRNFPGIGINLGPSHHPGPTKIRWIQLEYANEILLTSR
jgi:hypothetical protein